MGEHTAESIEGADCPTLTVCVGCGHPLYRQWLDLGRRGLVLIWWDAARRVRTRVNACPTCKVDLPERSV